MQFRLCALVVVASLVLGGGTRGGFLSDVILQIIAIPALLASAWIAYETPLTRGTRIALAFCAVVAVTPLVQLLPLPPWFWTALPNRDVVAAGFNLIETALPWMPISLAPTATWLSALSVLAPLAVFMGTLLLDHRQRRAMTLIIIGVGTVSAFLGLLQIAQGPASPLRFFEVTNPSEAVGFFANRNHFAALLYAVTLFAAAWAINISVIAGSDVKRYDVASIAMLIGGFTVLVVLVSGQAMARSRAGIGLTIVALLGAFSLAVSDRRATSGVTPAKLLVGAIALAAMFAAQYALFRILDRFEADPLEDARIAFARNTLAAAWAYTPIGSGLGSFVAVYGLFEKPGDALANTYANRAHNDVLELWLETGIVGLVLMGLFAMWFVLRCFAIWRRPPDARARDIDRLLARAATIVIALLLAHSFVDYPLRTGAMMAIMAFSCALLVDPPARRNDAIATEAHEPEPLAQRRRRYRSAPAPVVPSAAPSSVNRGEVPPIKEPAPARLGHERWGAEIEWPEAWREPAKTMARPPTDPAGARSQRTD